MMDTVFPGSTIKYRAIEKPLLHQLGYLGIILAEAAAELLCAWGAARLWRRRHAPAREFNRGKDVAIAGLTLGFLLWQVGFMTIGGEWFGMWMSTQWNGIESAFRFFITILAVLVYLALPDGEMAG
jgi:predicted small integral membrane protein